MSARARAALVLSATMALTACDAGQLAAPDAAARLASGGNGGATSPCLTTISSVSVTSGGNRGGHTPIPNSMHVFVDYVWRPCAAGERIDVTILDHNTGLPESPIMTPFMTNGQVGMQYKATSYSSNGKTSYPYDVIIQTSNPVTGVVMQTVARSIITDKKF